MRHKGIDFTVMASERPGIWKWQFQIGDKVKTGKTETSLSFLAVRRVQLRIDGELRSVARALLDSQKSEPRRPDL